MTPAQTTRRTFLAGATGMAVLTMLSSCTTQSPAPGPDDDAYGQALKLLRDAIRASPDHLPRRADDVVATRDADKIVAFVRDHVAVVPAWATNEYPQTARRWGSAAALHGGQDTLRERADLTAELLTRAGFKANVKVASRPAAIDQAALYRPRQVDFAPDQSRVDQAHKLLASAGFNAPATPPSPARESDPVPALLDALPANAKQLTPRSDLLPDELPLVAYEDHGTTRYAFALGDTSPVTTAPAGLADAPDPGPLPTVSVTVSAMASPSPGSAVARGELIDLVSGQWTTDVVVGRQLLLTFVPPEGPQALLTHRATDLPIRMPVLRVQTDTPPGQPELSKAGPLISAQGDVFRAGPDGRLDGPYGSIATLSEDARKAALARVATIQASADGAAFPEVELRLSVHDNGGGSVDGLDARSFVVTDTGTTVSSLAVRSNSKDARPPRVLIAYDTSSSIGWPTPAAKETFENALASTLTEVTKQTPIETQIVSLGNRADKGAWKAPSTESVIESLRSAPASGSSVWDGAGGDNLNAGPTTILLVTDFAADDDPAAIPGYQARLARASVPVFCLPMGDADKETLAKIASISGGAELDPNDGALATKLAALIKPLATKQATVNYRLSYLAPTTAAGEHTVSISLAGRAQPVATAKYQAPATPAAPPSFVGLYATINVNGVSTTRRLAGVPLTATGGPATSLDDPLAAAETRAAIYGVTTFAFEPGTTTTGAMLDDIASTFISIDPVRRIWPKKPTAEEIIKAAGQGLRRTPFPLAPLLLPPTVTAEATMGLRVAILQERGGPKGIERHVDLPPDLNKAIALSADPAAAFRSAMSVSVCGSAAEATAFADSAYARLRGQQLTAIVDGQADAFLNTVPAQQQAAWQRVISAYQGRTMLVPPQGKAEALWVIDPDTGSAKAILLDATGGALTLANGCANPTTMDNLSVIVGAISAICTGLGYTCLGITVANIALTAAAIFDNANSGALGVNDGWGITGLAFTGVGALGPFPANVRAVLATIGLLTTMGGVGCLG